MRGPTSCRDCGEPIAQKPMGRPREVCRACGRGCTGKPRPRGTQWDPLSREILRLLRAKEAGEDAATWREVAEQFGVTHDAVMQRASRIRQRGEIQRRAQ